MTKLYLAGPMRGIAEFNFPAFMHAADRLGQAGFDVHNPAQWDIDENDFDPKGMTGNEDFTDVNFNLAAALAHDIDYILLDADGVAVLPGWRGSKGATAEVAAALALGKPVRPWTCWSLIGQGDTDHSDHDVTTLVDELPRAIVNAEHGMMTDDRKPATGAPGFRSRDITSADRAIARLDVALAERLGEDVDPRVRAIADGRRPQRDPVGCLPTTGAAAYAEHRIDERQGTATVQRGEEVRVTSKTGGEKGMKLAQVGAVDPAALMAVAEVAGFGAQKYARYNYMRGYDWSLSFDAMMRHLLAFWNGEDLDPESGLPHLAHAGWHTLALLSFTQRGLGTDDRYKGDAA